MSLRCLLFGHQWIVSKYDKDDVSDFRYANEVLCLRCGRGAELIRAAAFPDAEWGTE